MFVRFCFLIRDCDKKNKNAKKQKIPKQTNHK